MRPAAKGVCAEHRPVLLTVSKPVATNPIQRAQHQCFVAVWSSGGGKVLMTTYTRALCHSL